ncbi:MAG: YlxM family DNA-binding protein [Solobacterium sp.]|nr:YlxM family DNA-binding protein [Solobacterium sp.]
MANKLEMDRLLDFYGVLLTGKQQEICDYYCRQDYSLQEIAEIMGTSRSAVYDIIHRCRREMEKYEGKLHLYRDHTERIQLLEEMLKTAGSETVPFIHKLIAKEQGQEEL